MIEHAYIHIPFCKRKCHYCSFISGLDIKNKRKYLDALLQEIKIKYKGEKLKTIYFGGGTPTLLDVEELKTVLSMFSYNQETEITIEANPETITLGKLTKIKEAGFNRISLGLQTFNNDILKSIGRNHSENTIYCAIENIKKAGFSNISIDLIYGLPNQTMELWKIDLEKAVSLNIQHISSYGLKIEDDSFFGKNPPKNLPDDEIQASMFTELCKYLKENNFSHYEVSNFAKKGFESKHNCAYWKNKNYYGFGLNASGYENDIRYKNLCDFEKYIKTPLEHEDEEFLSTKETMENEIFLGLRLKDGINITSLEKKYKINFESKYKKIIDKYTKLQLLKIENNNCYLTENGFLLSNEIMSEFID